MFSRCGCALIWACAWLMASCGGGGGGGATSATATPQSTTTSSSNPVPMLSALNPDTQPINSSFFGVIFGQSATISADQGYATDGTNNFLFSTGKIVQADALWKTVYTNEAPFSGITIKLDHVGDGEVSNGMIYAPLSCATQEACSPEGVAIGVYTANVKGLPLAQWADITSSGCDGSGIAVGPNNTLYVSNFFVNPGFICMFDATTLESKGRLTLSTPLPRIQGISFDPASQRFAVTTDNQDRTVGYIYFVSLSGEVVGPAYTAPQSGEMEGLDFTQGYIGYVVGSHNYVYFVFPFQVSGSDFYAASQVEVNGAAQQTTYESDGLLDVVIPGSLLGSFGALQVTVENPSPGGGASSALPFTVSPST
jgi:hypothetical protein